ncbi:MAG: hypothetical protein QW279_02670 [Candidatus Jordarchaeaceae archaeon]
MSTSVKISEESKRILEAIQARIVLKTGRKLSQQELLDMMVKSFDGRDEELIKLLGIVRFPLLPEEIEKLMEIPEDWGVETSEEEIDRLLYGGGDAE